MPRLLLVEDDLKIAQAVEKTLSLGSGFLLERVARAEEALPAALKARPDLVLLDVRLEGGGDGRAVLRALRQNAATSHIPVIMLTGMSAEGDKVAALNDGADDYVVKPFGAKELLARIEAVVRRCLPAEAGGVVRAGPLLLDRPARQALLRGKPLKLQPREFEILFLLAAQAGRPLSRSYLIEHSSAYGLPVSTRSLDTHVKNLRKKLGAARLIETVSKVGYRLRARA